MERYFDRQHRAMDRSSVFRKSYTRAMAASVEKPTQEEKCNAQGVVECKKYFYQQYTWTVL